MAGGTSTESHASLIEIGLNTVHVKSGHSADRSGGSDRGSQSSLVPDGVLAALFAGIRRTSHVRTHVLARKRPERHRHAFLFTLGRNFLLFSLQ